jgi:hypothetical protein
MQQAEYRICTASSPGRALRCGVKARVTRPRAHGGNAPRIAKSKTRRAMPGGF